MKLGVNKKKAALAVFACFGAPQQLERIEDEVQDTVAWKVAPILAAGNRGIMAWNKMVWIRDDVDWTGDMEDGWQFWKEVVKVDFLVELTRLSRSWNLGPEVYILEFGLWSLGL